MRPMTKRNNFDVRSRRARKKQNRQPMRLQRVEARGVGAIAKRKLTAGAMSGVLCQSGIRSADLVFLRPVSNNCPNDNVPVLRLLPPPLNRAIPYLSPHLRMSRRQKLPPMAPRSKRQHHGISAKKKLKNRRSLSLNVQIPPIDGKDEQIETMVSFKLIH